MSLKECLNLTGVQLSNMFTPTSHGSPRNHQEEPVCFHSHVTTPYDAIFQSLALLPCMNFLEPKNVVNANCLERNIRLLVDFHGIEYK